MKELEIIKRMDNCGDAVSWLETQESYEQAWQNCHRGDWMLPFLEKVVGLGTQNQDRCDLWKIKADFVSFYLLSEKKSLVKNSVIADCLSAIYDYSDKKINYSDLREKRNKTYAVSYMNVGSLQSCVAYAVASAASLDFYPKAVCSARLYNLDDIISDDARNVIELSVYASTFKKLANICRSYFPKAPELIQEQKRISK